MNSLHTSTRFKAILLAPGSSFIRQRTCRRAAPQYLAHGTHQNSFRHLKAAMK